MWQIYSDYLTKLHKAAISRFKSRRGADLLDRLATQDRIQYILTIPAAWQRRFLHACNVELQAHRLLESCESVRSVLD